MFRDTRIFRGSKSIFLRLQRECDGIAMCELASLQSDCPVEPRRALLNGRRLAAAHLLGDGQCVDDAFELFSYV